jgi:uncharacterized membrane protein
MPIIQLFTRYFLRGLLVVVPAALTLYTLYATLMWLDGLLDIERRVGVRLPGLGALIIVATVTLVGFLASNLLAGYLFRLTHEILTRLPLIRLIYTSIKDLLEAFVGDRKRFDRPVLVSLVPNGDAKVMGFVTRTSLHGMGMEDHVAVYLPQAYHWAGQLVFVPRNLTSPLAADSVAVMSFIVSGGVSGEASAAR